MDQEQEVDALYVYLSRLVSPSNGLSVIVDDSQLGHDVFIQIIKKCSEGGREVAGHYILKSKVTEKAMMALNLQHSNDLFAGINQKSFQPVINMMEDMGLLSFNDNLRMFITKRSIDGITGICNKPNYHYYIAGNQQSPSYTTYIVDKVNTCWRSYDEVGKNECLKRFVAQFMPLEGHAQIHDSKEYFYW